jgi:hypothetical protein
LNNYTGKNKDRIFSVSNVNMAGKSMRVPEYAWQFDVTHCWGRGGGVGFEELHFVLVGTS